jgi:cation transport ATPase
VHTTTTQTTQTTFCLANLTKQQENTSKTASHHQPTHTRHTRTETNTQRQQQTRETKTKKEEKKHTLALIVSVLLLIVNVNVVVDPKRENVYEQSAFFDSVLCEKKFGEIVCTRRLLLWWVVRSLLLWPHLDPPQHGANRGLFFLLCFSSLSCLLLYALCEPCSCVNVDQSFVNQWRFHFNLLGR